MFRILLLLSFFIPNVCLAYECNREIDSLSDQYGVKILCDLGKINLPARMTAEEVGKRKLNDAVPALRSFFSIYDSNFLRKNIISISLVSDIRVSNFEVGGLSNGREIFLNVRSYNSRYFETNAYIETLHHEFSSNVFKRVPQEFRRNWKLISDSYDYSREYYMKCLQNVDFAEGVSEGNLNLGYIENYSVTNEENDFNTYAEKLFMKNPLLLKNAKTHQIIRKKINYLKIMYRHLGFTGNFPDET